MPKEKTVHFPGIAANSWTRSGSLKLQRFRSHLQAGTLYHLNSGGSSAFKRF